MAIAAAAPVDPSPPLPARRTVAWLACTHLAWIAVDAVVCLLLASMWLFFWGLTTKEIGRLACGQGCAVVTVAHKVFYVAGVTFMLVLPLSMLLEWMLARAKAAAAVAVVAAAATDIGATKEPALKTSGAGAAIRRLLRDPVLLGLLASLAFALLKLIAVMGFPTEGMGLGIYYVGESGMNAVDCFVVCPLMTVRIWRSWRKARHAL